MTANAYQATVWFDGECGFCRLSVNLMKRLDWRHKLHFHSARDTTNFPAGPVPLDPARLLEEIHVLIPDGSRVYARFRAVRWILWRLPLIAPFTPLLYVPGVPWMGGVAYRWVARNRLSLVPCRNGVCRLRS